MTKGELGQLIKSERKKSNLTAKKLADSVGIHTARVFEIESGKSNLCLSTFLNILSFLRLEIK